MSSCTSRCILSEGVNARGRASSFVSGSTREPPLQPRGVRFLERALAGVELLLRLRAPAPAPDLAHVLAQRFFIHGLRPRGDSAGNPASAVARSNTRRWSEIVLCPRGDAGSWDKAGPRATRGSAPGSA